ncbi:hypothetical protein F442_15641, partial [Phytophthora nicotianae P10297]
DDGTDTSVAFVLRRQASAASGGGSDSSGSLNEVVAELVLRGSDCAVIVASGR